ncbi:MAG TPA: dipeptidase, partial [Holophaga sp.]|nr:dipeptidase [Holophaga sp.]
AQARAKAEGTLDALEGMFRHHSDRCEPAFTPADARRIHDQGKRALFMGMENGYPLGLDLDLLDHFHRRGIRYLTLCHASDNDLCAACTSWTGTTMRTRETQDTGLTAFGAQVVRRMNELGMMVDVSHTSEKTIQDVLAITKAPVIASHSGTRSISDHPRNLTDQQIRDIAAGGGVVQIYFVPFFLAPRPHNDEGDKVADALWTRTRAHYTEHAVGEDPAVDAAFEQEYQALLAAYPPAEVFVKDVADHIDHVVQVAGIDHVGIGTDFDGGARLVDCKDISELPNLTAELLRRGYTEQDIRKVWGGNLLRVFDQVLEARS